MTHPSQQSGAFPSASHRAALLEELRSSFVLDWHGMHGVCHWSRVWTNGRRLAQLEGGLDLGVLELFAWFHDSCRWGEGRDPEHGPRAALHARELRGEFFELEDARLELLAQACEGHTRGHLGPSPTVAACWDSDRLDIGRVGLRPDPFYLSSTTAKQPKILDWAYRRSLGPGELDVAGGQEPAGS